MDVEYKGADIPVSRTLTTDGTTPININSLDKIFIYVINKYSEIIIQKFQYPNAVGYDPIEIVDAVNGQIIYRIQSGDTDSAQTGILRAEYMLETNDVDYDDNTFHEVTIEDLKILRNTKIKAE